MTRQGPIRFTAISTGGWRDYAACARADDLTLWDATINKPETDQARTARYGRAKNICRYRCPVRAQCAAEIDPRLDEGVRGGHVLPTLTATKSGGNASARDAHLARLLRDGIPLDEAAAAADRQAHRRDLARLATRGRKAAG